MAYLNPPIANLPDNRFGTSSEHKRKLLDQLELEEVTPPPAGTEPRHPPSRTLPALLVVARCVRRFPPACHESALCYRLRAAYPCCGGANLNRIGESVTEDAGGKPA